MTEQDSIPDGLPVRQRIPAVIALLFCIAASSINITLINIALPVIASELHVGANKIIYVVSSYQLTLVLFLLVVSSLGDSFGYKRVFLTGTAVFTAASLGCAFSSSLPTLIFWRIVQGFGATAIQGSYFSLMTLIYPQRQLGRGIGLSAMTFSLTAIAGPPLAAGILAVAPWHWLFIINVPFGIIALILGGRYFPANVVNVPKMSIAVGDVALHIIVFGLFFFATSGWSHQPQQWGINTVLSVLCVITSIVYVRKQYGKQTPFLPIDLLRQGAFGFPIIFTILGFSSLLTAIVAVPFIFQSRFDYTASQTGLLLTVMTGMSVVASIMAGYGLERIKPIYLCGAGFAVFAVGTLSFAFLPEQVAAFDLIWRLGLLGIGSGLIQPANNFMAINAVPATRKGAANGTLSTSMMFGQILGMVVVSAVFSLTGSEATLYPIYLSGIIAIIAVGVVFSRLKV